MGTFYYAFFLIPVRLAYYGLSEPLMTPPELKGAKKSIGDLLKKTFLTPQMIAVFLGVVFWVLGWKLPAAINYCVKSLNTISSPLALLVCGMVIAEYDFKKLLHLEYFVLPVLRTVAMPALFFGISRLLLMAGVDSLLCNMFVVYGALPTASLLPVYAVKYDPDPENQLHAAGVSMISVFLSAITVPIWYLLLGCERNYIPHSRVVAFGETRLFPVEYECAGKENNRKP
jgi:predicted permease